MQTEEAFFTASVSTSDNIQPDLYCGEITYVIVYSKNNGNGGQIDTTLFDVIEGETTMLTIVDGIEDIGTYELFVRVQEGKYTRNSALSDTFLTVEITDPCDGAILSLNPDDTLRDMTVGPGGQIDIQEPKTFLD